MRIVDGVDARIRDDEIRRRWRGALRMSCAGRRDAEHGRRGKHDRRAGRSCGDAKTGHVHCDGEG
jgi:hypothetical protein